MYPAKIFPIVRNIYFLHRFDGVQMLPKEELYTPPMNIRVRDSRQFGRRPLVGVHVVKSLEEFRCNPLQIEDEDVDGTADQGVDIHPLPSVASLI